MELLNALGVNEAIKPFELRCNFIRGQGSLYYNPNRCTGATGDAVFTALLALHTLFRLGLVQKEASLGATEAKIYMINKLAQVRSKCAAHL